MSMESIYKLSVLVNMIDRISGPAATVQRVVGGTATKFQEYTHNMARMATDGAVLIGTGQQIATAALLPVKATFSTQDALAELASLGIQDLKKLEGAATDFSSTWAGTTKAEFLTAAYDIKSGIASLSDEGVASMTRIAGVTAKATKSTTAEMTSLFATGYGIYKDYYSSLSDEAFGEMFSAGIAKSVQQFKTTGSGMAQAISALGGSATAAAVPLEEQLAILGMLQATMSGSESGTKYTAFLQNAGRAGGELGLSFTDANGQLKGMPEILNQIKGKFGETMTAADKLELQKAFGTSEAVKLIELLYGKTDDLQGNILTLYDTMGQGMSITEEMANKINAPPGQSWQLFAQKVQTSMETIGNAMLPTFTKMQDSADKVITKFAEFTTKNPGVVSSFMYLLFTIGGLMMSMGVLKLLVGGVGSIFTVVSKTLSGFRKGLNLIKDGAFYAKYGLFLLKGALGPLKAGFLTMAGGVKTATLGMLTWAKQGIMGALTALPGLIASVWSFTAALLANPITWVVIAVIALVAALVLLWQNWDAVVQWFSSGFQKIMGWFGSLSGWVQAAIAIFLPFIGIPMLVVQYWEQIKGFFTGLIDWFKNIGASIMQGFTGGIMSFISGPVDAVKGALEKVRNLLPFSDAKTGPLSDLTLSGQRVFETMNTGMMTTADLPAQTAQSAFANMNAQLTPPPWQINPSSAEYVVEPAFSDMNMNAPSGAGGGLYPTTMAPQPSQEKGITISKLELKVDLSSIEDLKKLKKLILELEDGVNSSGTPAPSPA